MSPARFLKDRKGGVAPLLALCMIPIMGAVAASVDYSRASSIRSAMQAALDATGLMLSKDVKNASDQVSAQATTYFMAVFNHPEAKGVTVTPVLTSPSDGSFDLSLTATATIDMMFMPGSANLKASSEVLWGIKKLNLALVLDNTGSMAQSGKMDALKTASHNLLSTLKAASKTPGDIQVSIVPFALDVNVGTANVGADWIDWTDWNNDHGSCSKTKDKTQSSCLADGKTWTAATRDTWNGCVADRDQNYDVRNTTPLPSNTSTQFPADQASACPVPMMALSSDWTALDNKVDAMTPAGNTNITIGLALGWQTLTAAAPFNGPAAADDLDKVMILLTDGENTQNRWTTSATSINARTTLACNNIKAANIKIYTVRVIDGNASLLQSCASKTDMYYDVQDAGQLNGVFTAIAQTLANLRLAK
jgi:Flp pilus assembly protein TadG